VLRDVVGSLDGQADRMSCCVVVCFLSPAALWMVIRASARRRSVARKCWGAPLVCASYSHCVVQVGITGKYGTRYGASLRKRLRKMEVTQHAKYNCAFCGKDTVKRSSTGIWDCRSCRKTVAGGAYVLAYVVRAVLLACACAFAPCACLPTDVRALLPFMLFVAAVPLLPPLSAATSCVCARPARMCKLLTSLIGPRLRSAQESARAFFVF